jgi:hypothetical protein
MINIDDLIYSYPDQFDPYIQTKITSKYEFLELASYPGEPPPSQPGKLFRHQELIKRLLLVYDRLLLFHGTGTGKTASSLGPAEYFKQISLSGVDDFVRSYLSTRQTYIKRVVVLTRGQSLIREIRNQLAYQINREDYLPPDLPEDYVQANKRINALIRQYYDIDTYGRFFSESCSRGNISDDDIVRMFSDYMFVIDEAHNLNIVSYEGWTEDIYSMSMVDKANHKKLQIYQILHRIFHTAKRVKVLLLTATPMIDKTYEIISLMNLILPLDRQLTYDILRSGISLEPYFRGLVSYVKESGSNVNIQYQGYELQELYPESYDGYHTIVYPVVMSSHQGYYYRQLYNSGSTYRIPERQAANFVYPDGSYGKEGFNKYVIRERPDVYKPSDIDGFSEMISTYDGLYKSSSKFAEIIRICRDSPGSCFVTSEFKEAGSYILSVCFRAQGFEQYTGYGVFQSRKHQRGIALIRDESVIDPTFKPALRFALISPETSPNMMKNILDLFNNHLNRHGDYVKVLIGSPIINIGINLRNVTQIHVVGPSWDQSITYQSISRAIRATSHVDLIAETGNVVDINIYQYASIIDGPNIIDLEMYKISEDKQRDIDQITDLMKSVAIDAQIHQLRNGVIPYYPPPTDIDYTSYDILYSNEVINNIISYIQYLFSYRFRLSFNDIVQYTGSYRYVIMALSRMLTNKTPIINRYGYRCFLRHRGNIFYLVNDTDYTDGYYTENLISYRPITIEQYLSSNIRSHDIDMVNRLRDNPSPSIKDIISMLDSVSLSVKAMLLETAISQYIMETSSVFDNMIIQIYQNYIFWFNEPIQEIESYVEMKSQKYVGRKKKYPHQLKIRKLNQRQLQSLIEARHNQEPLPNETMVYLHTLYTLGYDRVSYAVTARYMKADSKIRLLKPGNKWRDVNDNELYIYNVLIQLEIYKRIQYYEQYDIYGIYFQSSDKKFRIRDKTTEDPEEAKRDNRKLNRGRDCMTLKKSDIVIIMRKVGVPEPSDTTNVTMNQSYNNMRSFLISQGFEEYQLRNITIDDIKYYYQWMDIRYSRDYLCDVIREYMMSQNRVFVI